MVWGRVLLVAVVTVMASVPGLGHLMEFLVLPYPVALGLVLAGWAAARAAGIKARSLTAWAAAVSALVAVSWLLWSGQDPYGPEPLVVTVLARAAAAGSLIFAGWCAILSVERLRSPGRPR